MIRTSHTLWLRHTLLQALGLSAACAAALPSFGCGGKVEVDGTGIHAGEGGGGGAGGGSTGAGGPACSFAVAEGHERVTACLPLPGNGQCAPHDALSVFEGAGAQLNQDNCVGTCCTHSQVSSVPCGPTPQGGACCYDVDVAVSNDCTGRPFTVDGEARTALVASRSDWTMPIRIACASLDDATRAALAEAWTRDALDEHASIASFARFALELAALGAPPDLIEDAGKALADEVRHARMCFGIATAYAGLPLGPGALPVEGALAPRVELAAVAESAVREGCIGETLASLRALDAGAAAIEPSIRDVLATIANDEAAHAALAFRFVAWALEVGGPDVRAAVERAFAEATAPIPPPDPEGLRPDVLRAHGRTSATERYISAVRTIDEVVRPAAAAILAHRQGQSQPVAS